MTITSNISTVNVTTSIVPDIVVAKDGSGNYTTIQAGINAANIGNIILVKNGLYPEKVIGNKSLQIYGQSKQNTIIDGTNILPRDLYSDWEYGIVELRANNISFRNIKVQNGKMAGVVSVNASNLYIENIITKNTTGSGIQCHNGNNIHVRYNELDRPGQASSGYKHQEQLSLAGPGTGIDGFEISYNYVHNGGVDIGIDMKQGCKNGTCHHNYVNNSGTGGNIYVDSWDKYCENIDVYKNLVENNGKSMGMAPEMGGTLRNITFRDNILYNNREGWFSAWSGKSGVVGTISNLTIKNNIIYKNKYGIILGKGYPTYTVPTYSNVLIQDNIVCNNINTPQIYIRPDIPSSAYTLLNNHTILDYISLTEFNSKRNALYNEIFG